MLSAAWLGGLLMGLWYPAADPAIWLLAGATALMAMAAWLAKLPVLPALLAALLILGVARASEAQGDGAAWSMFAGEEVTASGRIVDDPESSARRVRFELLVNEVRVDGETRVEDEARAEGQTRVESEARRVDERWLVYADPADALVAKRHAPFFRYGDEITVRGTPMEPRPFEGFDYAAYLSAQGISATMFAQEAQVTGEGGARWRSTVFTVRGLLASAIERAMPYPESALASAVLLGKRESLPPELVEKFRGTGAAHLLAISGLHVGVLLAATAGTAAWLLGRQRPGYLVVAGATIWMYALVAGAPPSALRAAVMGTVYLFALGVGRPASVLPALAMAAAVMTAVSPNLVKQVSFQLSFAAVGGIALGLALLGSGPAWRRPAAAGWAGRLAGWAAGLMAVSAAATLATWPLVATNFGQVALLSVPSSLLAIPAMAPLIVLTLAAAIGALVTPVLGTLAGWLAAASASWVIGVVSALPSWTVEGEWVGKPLLLAWYGALGLALLAAQPQRTRRWRQWISNLPARSRAWLQGNRAGAGRGWRLPSPYRTLVAATALSIAAAILWVKIVGGPDGYLHVHFLDVGQGDGILITTPSGRQALIDGGPDGDVTSQELAEAMPGGHRSLDLVVMTHLDSDHSGGLLEVLDRYAVGAVLSGTLPPGDAMRAQWEQRLDTHDITAVMVHRGYAIELDEGVSLEVLNPHQERPFGSSNDDSIVLRLTYGEVSVLLAADIESVAEERLSVSGAALRSTVLKVAHHGSRTSTTPAFLQAVDPAVAVISAGAGNPYGHPAQEVVELLEDSLEPGNVYRTDQHGTVEVVSDGASLWVLTER